MTTANKHLLVSIAIFAVALLSFAIAFGSIASGTVDTLSKEIKTAQKPVTISPRQESQPVQVAETAPVVVEEVQTYQQPVQTQTAPQAPSEVQQMERIPFTSKPVEAGNPESYIGTYGQCPFYENAGEKGCFPPSYIQCNSDWSICEYNEINDKEKISNE